MTVVRKIKRAFRGQVSPRAALFEIGRRGCVALRSNYERSVQSFEGADVGRVGFIGPFANMTSAKLLEHFRIRSTPRFFPGFELAGQKRSLGPPAEIAVETSALLGRARAIVDNHSWQFLGLGELSFGEKIEWLRDPVSGARWLRDVHGDVALKSDGDADVRVLCELNRMGHLITLGQAYAVTGDEDFAEEAFVQVGAWLDQNRPGLGPNWSSAMEVALRAMNLLATFQLLRGATRLTEERLMMMLTLFEQHGRYIRGHLEFSYIATSNHYLSDVVGLLWLGICLPELEQAHEWRAFGLREMLREMDKQVLSDGAHYESSTGYHRFVLELFLYSFILCRGNGIEIGNEYWQKLRSMVDYSQAYLRPDGQACLIGDTDSGQVMPMASHLAADHGYVLDIAAAFFSEAALKTSADPPEEIFWLLGETALDTFRGLVNKGAGALRSERFPEAGTFILRAQKSYLLLNANGSGLSGRGSHSHNDALSVEVSACGTSFISDPGTYVYTGDLVLRNQFRSTAYHSTVEVDRREQNTIEEALPFYIGNEASPRQLHWESTEDRDVVIAEHYGYQSLPHGPITHRRTVTFEKTENYWLIEDALTGSGKHVFRFCFHVAPGLEVLSSVDGLSQICDTEKNTSLVIVALHSKAESDAGMNLAEGPVVETRWFSRDYGSRVPSGALCWAVEAEAPLSVSWLLVPICAAEDTDARLALVERLRTTSIGNASMSESGAVATRSSSQDDHPQAIASIEALASGAESEI